MYEIRPPHIKRITIQTSNQQSMKKLLSPSVVFIICDLLPTGIRKSDLEIRVNEQIVQCKDIYGNYALKCETRLLDHRSNEDLKDKRLVNLIYIRLLTTGCESNRIEYVVRSEITEGINYNNPESIEFTRPLKSRFEVTRFTLLRSIRNAKSIITHQSYDEKTKWRKLARLIYDYSWENNSRVTFFHDAVISEDSHVLDIFNELLESPSYIYYLSTVKTAYGESLLSYACKMNKPEFVRHLIKIPSLLYKQDSLGNTPLHIAINKRHDQCVAEFLKIMQPTLIKSKLLRDALIRMIRCYNQANYQVLHTSIIAGNSALTKVLLDFCASMDIEISSLRVLGSNQSIIDLLVQTGNTTMNSFKI